MAACSSPDRGGDAPLTTSPTDPTSTTLPTTTSTIISTGDLDDPDVRQIRLDGETLLVAWADTPDERSRGLMEVEDLGDVDGMLFDLGSERTARFTMRNTLIPLDIYFFDTAGQGMGMLEMVPCESEPCPSYSIDAPARYALEVPAGSLDVADRPRLELG